MLIRNNFNTTIFFGVDTIPVAVVEIQGQDAYTEDQ